MKKIIYTLLVAILAFSFMGCPTVNSDLPPQLDLTGLFLKGEADGWGAGFPLEKQEDGTWTVKFVAPAAEMQFKIATADWSTAYPVDAEGVCIVLPFGEEAEFFAGDSGLLNPKITGLVKDAEYTMVITPLSASIMIKVVGEAAAPAPTPDEEEAVAAELKAIVGSIIPGGSVWTALDESLVYEFTYNGDGDAWADGAANQVSFKISVSATEDWGALNFGGVKFKTNELVKLVPNPGMSNGVITGLVSGTTYQLIINSSVDGVYVVCVAK